MSRPLCHFNDIPEGESRGFTVEGMALFAVKKDAELYLYKNECPHLGVNLEWKEDEFLDLDGELIECAMHGALFQITDGHCIAGPCQGESLKPLPWKMDDGQVYLL
ncbi:Rieske (2Fe-2S) protein [Natronospirillum operosum]|uniref:Rieske (2Fe-2S) protein n=1 Tax=Natronospirillum operosum TaxID=2759953 RepID=A0A4Z0WFI8_9GAMM|nr:Rieske (2Fe-2S) protein [Natronospirillum operosum]TGG94066.1 Rieske (2Fe-2S) protein [Natronospirillum operosum]